MIFAGSDLKFRITAIIESFKVADNDFNVVVKNKWGQVKYVVEKDEMFTDDKGNYYFTLESVPAGVYYAIFTATVLDDDYDKLTRTVVDMQHLCSVSALGSCNCQGIDVSSTCNCDHKVGYEQVWTVNVDGGIYLAGSDGALILTEDGKRIQLKKEDN